MKRMSINGFRRLLPLLLLAALINGCGDNDKSASQVVISGPHRSAYHEHEFSGTSSRTLPTDTVVVALEHPKSELHAADSGGAGFDEIPYTFPETKAYTFCIKDDDGEAHFMTLRDSLGNEILRVVADGECVTKTITAGDYLATLTHGGAGLTDPKPDTVFIQHQYGTTAAAAKSMSPRKTANSSDIEQIFISTSECVGCDFTNAQMDHHDFSGCDLKYSDFDQASLYGANFSNSQLQGTDFSGANLQTANLAGAQIQGSLLKKANLKAAKFQGAVMGRHDTKIGISSDPAAFTYHGYFHVVVRGTDGNLWHRWRAKYATTWGAWQIIARNIHGDPSLNTVTFDGGVIALTAHFIDSAGNLSQVQCWEYQCTDGEWKEGDGELRPYGKIVYADATGNFRVNIQPTASPSTSMTTENNVYYSLNDVNYRTKIIEADHYKVSAPTPLSSDGGPTSTTRIASYKGEVYFRERSGALMLFNNEDSRYSTVSAYAKKVRNDQVVMQTVHISSAPSATPNGVFYRQADGNLGYVMKDNCKTSYSYQTSITLGQSSSPLMISAPSVTGWPDNDEFPSTCISNTYYVFYKGSDGNLWKVRIDPASGGDGGYVIYSSENWGTPGEATTVSRATDFHGADLQAAVFDANLDMPKDQQDPRVNLTLATIDGDTFAKDQWKYFDMSGVTIMGDYWLEGVNLENARLNSAYDGNRWRCVRLSTKNLKHADFSKAQLNGACMNDADLEGANLTFATMRAVNLTYANLKDANLTGANLEAAAVPYSFAGNLSYAYLPNAKLDGAQMEGVSFEHAHFYGSSASAVGAHLTYAKFGKANLSSLDFGQAILDHADFLDALLYNTNFSEANLNNASFSGAILKGADLASVTDFSGVSLSGALIALDSGTIETQRLGDYNILETVNVNYAATTLPITDGFNTCPSGDGGPCSGHALISHTPPVETDVCVPSITEFCPPPKKPLGNPADAEKPME